MSRLINIIGAGRVGRTLMALSTGDGLKLGDVTSRRLAAARAAVAERRIGQEVAIAHDDDALAAAVSWTGQRNTDDERSPHLLALVIADVAAQRSAFRPDVYARQCDGTEHVRSRGINRERCDSGEYGQQIEATGCGVFAVFGDKHVADAALSGPHELLSRRVDERARNRCDAKLCGQPFKLA